MFYNSNCSGTADRLYDGGAEHCFMHEVHFNRIDVSYDIDIAHVIPSLHAHA